MPTTPPHSGDMIPVTWTVTNLGNRDTREGFWLDRVYLSRSPSLDDQSYMLGVVSARLDPQERKPLRYDAQRATPRRDPGEFLHPGLHRLESSSAPPRCRGFCFEDGIDPFLSRVGEYQGEGNNITAAYMPVILTIPPDLQVTSVIAAGPDPSQPGHVQTGQSYTVTYTVTNAGAGDTPDRQPQWDDWIFLSRDPILDGGDTFLGLQDPSTGGSDGRPELPEHRDVQGDPRPVRALVRLRHHRPAHGAERRAATCSRATTRATTRRRRRRR